MIHKEREPTCARRAKTNTDEVSAPLSCNSTVPDEDSVVPARLTSNAASIAKFGMISATSWVLNEVMLTGIERAKEPAEMSSFTEPSGEVTEPPLVPITPG